MKAAQTEVKVHAVSAMHIERAVQQRQHTVQEVPKLPETQLKKVEKPVTVVEPVKVTPVEMRPELKSTTRAAPKPKPGMAQPPQFSKPLSPVKAEEGKPATLEVEFEGFPPPQISWYRESFEIKPSNDFQV